jgi:hypothetical protein
MKFMRRRLWFLFFRSCSTTVDVTAPPARRSDV